MRENIVSKISDELSKGIASEAQVLYLLVEIRKVRQANVNQTISRGRKSFLDFYRDWVCHVELNYDNTVKAFLDRFEPFVNSNLTAREIARSFIDQFPSFFKLEELRNELRHFFESEGVSTELTDDLSRWYVFVKHLLGILQDCSIRRLHTDGQIEELVLEVDNHKNAKFKFHLRGRKDIPVCKLKWK